MKRLLLLLLVCGCAPAQDVPQIGADCTAGKCDTPNTNACVADLVNNACESPAQAARDCNLAVCAERRGAALESQRVAFTPNALRWSCADVRGVNAIGQDDRGQEYCEYFAIVKLPATGDPVADRGVGVAHSVVLGRAAGPAALKLTAPQLDALDLLGSREVGRCIFTSWQQDVAGPVPACAGASCPSVLDEPISTATFRMARSINSNYAARDLLEKCLGAAGDPTIADPFTRGCMLDAQLMSTNWRKSDSSICAAAMRLSECGCAARGVAANAGGLLGALLSPQPGIEGSGTAVTLRGFPLGGWSGPGVLPAGCQYVDTGVEASGASSRTIVSCSLSASDVLTGAGDLKSSCREKYGDNVVVYVPVPAAAIACSPPAGARCSAQPWVITP